MAHYRAPDSKREQFRRYLEKAGVVDSLTSGSHINSYIMPRDMRQEEGVHPAVLVSLYEQPEKPSNALEFIKQQLSAVGQTSADTEALQQEVIDLRQRCARLAEENKDLKAKLQRCERVSEDGGTSI